MRPRRPSPPAPPIPPPPAEDPNRDLGFGAVVASESRRRLLNRDGSFNVRRTGLGWRATLSLYHTLLTLSWPRFLALGALLYLVVNALFAVGFFLLGAQALAGSGESAPAARFAEAFFFSVQTFSTVGYGQLAPRGVAANLLMTAESFVDLLAVALATGLVFARFSRPHAKIVFSRHAIIAPYHGGTAFEFRIANRRRTQLSEVAAKVSFTRFEDGALGRRRRFYELPLERQRVAFFPLSWTIVHPIDEHSPLHGVTREELLAADAEFLVLLTGVDETFSQTVHTRSSYQADEVLWNVRFADIFQHPEAGEPLSIDVERIDEVVEG
jgi:inward rectifier potassium channel